MAANLAALIPEPSKAASISCLLASGVRTRPTLSCLRISPADTIDAVDVIASRLRHLHYLRQVVLRATLTRRPRTCCKSRGTRLRHWHDLRQAHSRNAHIPPMVTGAPRRATAWVAAQVGRLGDSPLPPGLRRAMAQWLPSGNALALRARPVGQNEKFRPALMMLFW